MRETKEIIEEWLKKEKTFRYQMLGRLAADCEYYLGYGIKCVERLWAHDEARQIELMIALYNSFGTDEKPQWLSMEQIMEYQKEMIIVTDNN